MIDLGEVALHLGVRLVEALGDRGGEVADQPAQLAQRPLEVGDLLAGLVVAAPRLLVLLLGERVDRAELLAAALEPLDLVRERGLLVGRQRLDALDRRRAGALGDLGPAAHELAEALLGVRALDLERRDAAGDGARVALQHLLALGAGRHGGGQLAGAALEALQRGALGHPQHLDALGGARQARRWRPAGSPPARRWRRPGPGPRRAAARGRVGRLRVAVAVGAAAVGALARGGAVGPPHGDGLGQLAAARRRSPGARP